MFSLEPYAVFAPLANVFRNVSATILGSYRRTGPTCRWRFRGRLLGRDGSLAAACTKPSCSCSAWTTITQTRASTPRPLSRATSSTSRPSRGQVQSRILPIGKERCATTAMVKGVRRCVGAQVTLVSRNLPPSCWVLGSWSHQSSCPVCKQESAADEDQE